MTTKPESEAVRVKREAQEKLDEATRGMSPRERDAFVNRCADEFAKRLGLTQVSRPVGRGPDVGSEGDRQAG
jgi:hypothetical protein